MYIRERCVEVKEEGMEEGKKIPCCCSSQKPDVLISLSI